MGIDCIASDHGGWFCASHPLEKRSPGQTAVPHITRTFPESWIPADGEI